MPDGMTLACQYGRCGECPDADECVCECHIDDDTQAETQEHATMGVGLPVT